MKDPFLRILSYASLALFFLYWMGVLILALPSNAAKTIISGHSPRFKAMFENSWKLFTPPFTYNDRLYFIVKARANTSKADTIEVLADMALQKQKKAPFNQRENIVDHAVNNSVTKLIRTIWLGKKMPSEHIPDTTDSTYISRAINEAAGNKNYFVYLGTLENYCKKVLSERNIDPGREVKMIIAQKMIRPFKEMFNTDFLQKETVVFETPYKLLR